MQYRHTKKTKKVDPVSVSNRTGGGRLLVDGLANLRQFPMSVPHGPDQETFGDVSDLER